ncbi:hypothetical protein HXZ94_00095 [Empedobacter falsenii]|uniref:AbaSI family restriction endonuclease n=1 Tax=Empedobacter falsenii TaxID=343874 RepID=UPI002577C5FF|nr:hypothetical protein [Empedobacter falsenii]MDM1296903.1 hypothetical protein [Empedobacter falsenii]MDM1316696.1 hypothetical protein [Empedobacter falsenii]
MDYKLDYISRLLQKTSGKRIENYVISRIWHLLDNYDIKMTPQQYVSRDASQYALTDIYFPQIGLHVEVNEPAHYESEERIDLDLKRQQEIETNTGHQVFVIDCRQELIDIHSQIDKLVTLINSQVKEQIEKGIFKPWKPENEHNPIFWKEKGFVNISDEVSFFTIEDICLLFDADYQKTKRGFLRKGAISNPKNINQLIWWPSKRPRSGWLNNFDETGGTITETHSDEKRKSDHYYYHAQGTHIRICFFHYTDILGLTNYKYVGVFTNDKEKSNPEIGTVWKRIGDKFNLNTTEIS